MVKNLSKRKRSGVEEAESESELAFSLAEPKLHKNHGQ